MYKVMCMFKKLNKKRITVVCLMVMVSIISFNASNNREKINSETISANSTPITNKVVILDAGHRFTR